MVCGNDLLFHLLANDSPGYLSSRLMLEFKVFQINSILPCTQRMKRCMTFVVACHRGPFLLFTRQEVWKMDVEKGERSLEVYDL